jgi:hypothetical protein
MRFAVCLLLCAGCVPGNEGVSSVGGGGGPMGGQDFPGVAVSADAAPPLSPPRRLPPDGGVITEASCLERMLFPLDCNLVGEWRLLHSQPDSPCPFGASRHVIHVDDVQGLLCLEPGEDFQAMAAGPVGTCALVLTGRHDVTAASEAYSESWTSRLTFTGDTGTGETTVVVTGGSNCMRKFQTVIDRK